MSPHLHLCFSLCDFNACLCHEQAVAIKCHSVQAAVWSQHCFIPQHIPPTCKWTSSGLATLWCLSSFWRTGPGGFPALWSCSTVEVSTRKVRNVHGPSCFTGCSWQPGSHNQIPQSITPVVLLESQVFLGVLTWASPWDLVVPHHWISYLLCIMAYLRQGSEILSHNHQPTAPNRVLAIRGVPSCSCMPQEHSPSYSDHMATSLRNIRTYLTVPNPLQRYSTCLMAGKEGLWEAWESQGRVEEAAWEMGRELGNNF